MGEKGPRMKGADVEREIGRERRGREGKKGAMKEGRKEGRKEETYHLSFIKHRFLFGPNASIRPRYIVIGAHVQSLIERNDSFVSSSAALPPC